MTTEETGKLSKGTEELVIAQGNNWKHYLGCSLCGTQLIYKQVSIRPWGHYTTKKIAYCPKCQKRRNASQEIIVKFEKREGFRWVDDPIELRDYNQRIAYRRAKK